MVIKRELNYYQILNIDINSTEAEIKAAYRKLVRKYHPDVNPDDINAAQKFKEITEAYETLSNKSKREYYDKLNNFVNTLHENMKKDPPPQEPFPYRKTYKTPNEPKTTFGDIFNDILDSFKSTRKTNYGRPKPTNGTNIYTTVTISQKEALEGTVRTVNILHTSLCHNCFGRKILNGIKCPLCEGKGEVSVQKKINVKIPPFVHDGSKIRIANEGNQGLHGGMNGDLYLTIFVEKASKFSYEGDNAFIELPIAPYEAALGASIEVSTPNGSVTMKIPKCTCSGQKFRLSGQGLNKSGDLVVTVKVCLPKELTKEEEILYERLKSASACNIRE